MAATLAWFTPAAAIAQPAAAPADTPTSLPPPPPPAALPPEPASPLEPASPPEPAARPELLSSGPSAAPSASSPGIDAVSLVLPALGAVALGLVVWRGWWRVGAREEARAPTDARGRAAGEGEIVVILVLGGLALWLAQGLGMVSAKAILSLSMSDLKFLRGLSLAGLGGYVGTALAFIVVAVAAPWMMRMIGARPDRRSVVIGVVGALVVLPITALTGFLVTRAMSAMGFTDVARIAHDTLALLQGGPGASSNDGLIADNAAAWWWVTVLGVVIGAPIVEELIYRGMLQTAMRRAFGSSWAAIGLTSVLFALAHAGIAEPHALPVLAVLSIGFGVVYERSGRVAAPIIVHMAFNALNVLVASVG